MLTPDRGAMKPVAGTSKRRTAAETREHVLAVAQRLFYWHGIRATGVDKIAAEAGVAPTTLYRLFASKDDLVAAYVEGNAGPYKHWVTEITRPELGTPRERILSLFDALGEQVQPERCRGCPLPHDPGRVPRPGAPRPRDRDRHEGLGARPTSRADRRALSRHDCH